MIRNSEHVLAIAEQEGGADISHLFFADDLVFWGEATDKQAEAMASILRRFCGTAGKIKDVRVPECAKTKG